MGLFDKIRPAYVTAPVEPPVPDEVRIAEIDIKLRSIAVIPRCERGEGSDWQTDRLLDLRNAIRPAREPRPVPVVQGYVDTIIDNYGENPW
jgi:hypothetical protein